MNLYSIYQRLFLRARMRIAGLALPNPLHNTHVHNTKLQAHPVAMIICLFASWRFCWSMHNALQTCTCARVYGYNACQLVVHLVLKQTTAHLWHSQKPVMFDLMCSSFHILSVLHMYKNEPVWPLETCILFHLLSLLWLDLFTLLWQSIAQMFSQPEKWTKFTTAFTFQYTVTAFSIVVISSWCKMTPWSILKLTAVE